MSRIAVVTGMIGTYPMGGVVWDYGQYALGLERMGFEVFYLEDSGMESYDPVTYTYGPSCEYAVRYLPESLGVLSPNLAQRWHYRSAEGETYGMSANDIAQAVRHADLFLNVSGSALLRDEYISSRRKVLIDTDPGWNHFVNYPRNDEGQRWPGARSFREHDFFFTYAENICAPDCVLPNLGIDWITTRPLVVMDCWQAEPPGDVWTTVMTWDNFRRPIEYEGVIYGTKEREFPKAEDLPRRVNGRFELATGGNTAPRNHWRNLGWSVVESEAISRTPAAYRQYVQQSRGEFSVAKNVYVDTRSGWFSCRTVCYLAAGRPAVIQDTAFSRHIPCGTGLFAFQSLTQAEEAIRLIEQDYPAHAQAAKTLADTHFSDHVVLDAMLRQIGVLR